METSVSLLENYNNSSKINKSCYLIQIKRDSSIWYLTKRYKQIYHLKIDLEKKHKIKIANFPPKKIFRSYSRNIVDNRIRSFNSFFTFINTHENLAQDSIYEKFTRSDVYLDSYRDIQQTDILKTSIVQSEQLNLKLNDLESKVDILQDEINSLADKLNIIKKNIDDSKGENQTRINYLVDVEISRKNTHDGKIELVDKISDLTKLYYSLRQKCCLVRNLKTGTCETISEYEILASQIRLELLRINNWVKDLDDKFINHYWKIDDYQRIGKLLETRLIPRIKNLVDKDY